MPRAMQRRKVKRVYLVPASAVQDQVRRKLVDRTGSWNIVEERTGVGRNWIAQFVRGGVTEAGFFKIFALARYLEVPLSESVSRPQ